MEITYKGKTLFSKVATTSHPLSGIYQKIYYGIILNSCTRISTLNALQNIDVLFIDKDNIIIEYKYNIPPNSYVENQKANTTIILPLNIFNLNIGDKIEIK